VDHIGFLDKQNLNKMKSKKHIYLLLTFHSDSEPFDKIFVNDSLYCVDKNGPYNTENRFDVKIVVKDEREVLSYLESIQIKGESDSLIILREKFYKRYGEKSKQLILAEKVETNSRSLSVKRKFIRKQWLIVGNINNLME